ncbi:MAG: fumarylacetoacetate hydrolase family protein [Proteobacteria bacterium]|nr:fumarylacetoacetate hydrolase family protein [Pseudomonadota bacterium]MDA1299008.1 fumarylacetoacetate hydrolase family protein [Pseudomonadota bacterium]
MNSADRAGQLLYQQHQNGEVFSVMTSQYAPVTLDDAYAVQDVYTRLLAGSESAFGGYKIAYTTPVMQQRLGASEPAFGRMLSRQILASPTTLRASDHPGLEVECEVALRIGHDLPPGDLTEQAVFDAVSNIMIAFELVNRRPFDGPRSLVQSIAMNVSNAGAVIGSAISEWRALDLPGSRAVLQINGTTVGEGHGRDVAGHPVRPLVWLAKALSKRGHKLTRGDIVITGSMIPPTPVTAGDLVVLSMDHLGQVELQLG